MLTNMLEQQSYEKDEFIIKDGDTGDYLYIIEEGEVECFKSMIQQNEINFFASSLIRVFIRTLSQFDYFGELALIFNVKRTLNVKVTSEHCRVLALGKENFNRILGKIQGNMKRVYNSDF
jgi:cAMP-dependent protein kinase regulator